MISFSEIEKVISDSYFNRCDEKKKEVLAFLQTLDLTNPVEALGSISRKKEPDLDKWNLFAAAWRTIERSIEYPFKVGDTVKIIGQNRTRVIDRFYENDGLRMAQFGGVACTLSMLEYANKEQVQLSIFDEFIL